MALEEHTTNGAAQSVVRPSTSALATDTASSKLRIEQVNISPGIAQAWLDRNLRNRRVRRALVRRLASDIRNDKWEVSGDAIRFDTDGNLIDGQHRLMACVEAGKAIRSFVVYGLDQSVQNVIDTGTVRSKGDMLALYGVSNANSVAYGYRLLRAHKEGLVPTTELMSHADMMDLYERHPKLPLYVPNAGSLPRGIPLGLVGFVAYVGATILKRKDRVDAMIGVLKTGVPDYEGDVMHRYRERVIARRLDSSAGEKTKRHEVIWTFYHAWNLFVEREGSGSRLTIQRDEVKIRWLKPSQL
jgi:hypothetical protein